MLPAAPPGFLGDVDAHHLLEGREGAVYVHHTARHAHQVVPVVRELGARHARSLPGGGIDRPFRAADRDGVERAFVVAARVVQLHLAVVRGGGEDEPLHVVRHRRRRRAPHDAVALVRP